MIDLLFLFKKYQLLGEAIHNQHFHFVMSQSMFLSSSAIFYYLTTFLKITMLESHLTAQRNL